MSVLDLDLDDRDFDALLEAARSRLPALAPGWTDYNLHDPGITLVELAAWLGDAQLYALGRLRRDERLAYARLAGVDLAAPVAGTDPVWLAGAHPARGLIWPDASDPVSLVNAVVHPFALATDQVVRPVDAQDPVFAPTHPTLVVPGRLTAVVTELADGTRLDRTAMNARGLVPYQGFGPEASARDALRLEFLCNSADGLADRGATGSSMLFVGVRADAPAAGSSASAPPTRAFALMAQLIIDGQALARLTPAVDTTAGLLRTGVLGFALPADLPPAAAFTLRLHAPRGFPRPPRLRRVEFNVVDVTQTRVIAAEQHDATGLPDQTATLQPPTPNYGQTMVEPVDLRPARIRYDAGAAPPRVIVDGDAAPGRWRLVRDLAACGPGDRAYAFDPDTGTVRFGNGVNGRVPPAGARILVAYDVCDGAAGNQPRPRAWLADGLGTLGRNLDPLAGGRDAQTLDGARAAARRIVRERHALPAIEAAAATDGERHPLVTADDLRAAALALADLEVGRAEVVAMPCGSDAHGTVTLVALRRRDATASATTPSEPQRWLDAVRAALQPRLPMGERLVVRAPAYLRFRIEATLHVAILRKTDDIEQAAWQMLAHRLAVIAPQAGTPARPLGLQLSARDVGAWLRKLDGVTAVSALVLRNDRGQAVDRIAVGPCGLPVLDVASSVLRVVRPAAGRSA